MDNDSASDEQVEAVPIFTAFRRGYDPEQVDRYVADQSRRLDEASRRASEAERKLAAAVGQLRELPRRVAVLESEERSPQPASLDTLGERVQRILQEAWEGAFAVRQGAEQEAGQLKEQALTEGSEIVSKARRKAEAVEEEIERRRRAYLERIDAERSRAAAQMTFLHEQRKLAVTELERVKVLIEATVAEVSDAPPSRGAAEATEALNGVDDHVEIVDVEAEDRDEIPVEATPRRRIAEDELARTMPVQRLSSPRQEAPDMGDLVRGHRATVHEMTPRPPAREVSEGAVMQAPRPTVFDFEQHLSENR